MSINSIGNNTPVNKVTTTPLVNKQVPADPPSQLPAVDKLELSGVSHLFKSLKNNDIRTDKVRDVKAQIDAGTYDQDGSKLDGSLNGLLDDLA